MEDTSNSREIAALLQHLAELRVELARIRARTQKAIEEAHAIRLALEQGSQASTTPESRPAAAGGTVP